ncbi:putative mannose-resistant/Proteus-like fimbrial protein [Yersinia aldovae]|uniref:fimbrial protein n=1 Tax=Yersinia aldovae TaxID=29483 RepID=UPI0005DCDD10|nr:fimbrial protein [Yersinia aldovae]CNI11759.1 putative mannose-resistant/Proteus-like fimbrial protein [Yersinia aldovae]
MKKNFIAVAIATASTLSGASAFAEGGDGKVNFKGEIIDSACNVVNSVSSPLDVTLGKVSKTAFNGAGSTSAPTKFTLQLKDCPESVTGATVKFDGTPVATDNSLLALTTEAGVATGVGIQLSDNSDKVLPLFTSSASYPLTSGTAVNNLDFVARYVATSETITPGPANSVANFTVNYN